MVVLLSTVTGAIALGGSAAALDAGAAATYPATPGSSTLGTFVYVARPSDSVAKDGIKTITLHTDSGSFANVSDNDIFISIRGGKRIEISNQDSSIVDVQGINVSSSRSGHELTITLPRPVRPHFASNSPDTGSEIAIKVGNFTTPSQPGSYTVNATLSTPSGATDGPVATNPYSLTKPTLSVANQSVSQFESTQTLNVTAAIPGGGYVGLFTQAPNGSPGELVGATNVSTSSDPQQYTIDVGDNISKNQPIMAVAYTESEGRSISLRQEQSFDPSQDNRLVVNGDLVNATAQVSTLAVDAKVTAGNEYDQGAKLYFAQGTASTSYRISTVSNGSLADGVMQFETAANGTAIIDTADLDKGRYAITRVDNGSLVSLDNDSTTGAGDDSFVVTGQQMATTANTTATNGTNATTQAGTTGTTATTGDAATETAAGSNGGGATQAGTNGSSANGSANASGGETGSSGPGFGIGVAAVALLGAGLLALRRR